MEKFKTIFYTTLIVVGVIFIGYSVKTKNVGGGVSVNRSCTTYSSTSAVIGNDLSSTLLTAYSNRAYAKIEVLDNSTDIFNLSFDEGASAEVGKGMSISSSTPFVEFGLNTDFPYVGAVTGITTTASTTVQITTCRY